MSFLLQVSEMLEVYVGVRLFWVVVNGDSRSRLRWYVVRSECLINAPKKAKTLKNAPSDAYF